MGQQAERFVSNLAFKSGYKLVANNFKTKVGEVDLIIAKNQTLVAVEVKYRSTIFAGDPIFLLTNNKIKKISNALMIFLSQNADYKNNQIRIDAITLTGDIESPRVNWIENITHE